VVDFEHSALEIHHDINIYNKGRLNDSGSVFSEDNLYGRIPAGLQLIR